MILICTQVVSFHIPPPVNGGSGYETSTQVKYTLNVSIQLSAKHKLSSCICKMTKQWEKKFSYLKSLQGTNVFFCLSELLLNVKGTNFPTNMLLVSVCMAKHSGDV